MDRAPQSLRRPAAAIRRRLTGLLPRRAEPPPGAPSSTTERWRLWALAAGMGIGGRMPRPVAYALARLAGDLAFRYRHGAREDVIDNMRHVLGPEARDAAVRAAAREAFRNVARYYVDLIRIPQMDLRSRIGRDVTLHGFDRLKSRLDAGQGVVVATAHFGNPEVAVQVGAVLGLDVLVLAEPLEPPAFAEMMRKLRSAYSTRYLDVSFGAVSETIRHLRAGGCLAITCDRDIQGRGVPLPFFGVETRMPLGAVEFAARTGATLLPGYCLRNGKRFEIYFEEPVELVNTGNARRDALTNARALLARAEAWIASDPGQWFVLERIWKPLPPGKEASGEEKLPSLVREGLPLPSDGIQ